MLLKKLEGYGIKTDCLDWVKSFLSSWYQKVIVNGDNSKWFSVVSGVPQGLHGARPITVSSVCKWHTRLVDSKIKMFANDIKIQTTITSFMQALRVTWISFVIGLRSGYYVSIYPNVNAWNMELLPYPMSIVWMMMVLTPNLILF